MICKTPRRNWILWPKEKAISDSHCCGEGTRLWLPHSPAPFQLSDSAVFLAVYVLVCHAWELYSALKTTKYQ